MARTPSQTWMIGVERARMVSRCATLSATILSCAACSSAVLALTFSSSFLYVSAFSIEIAICEASSRKSSTRASVKTCAVSSFSR